MTGQCEVFDPKIDCNLEVEVAGEGQMIVPQAKFMGGGSSTNRGTFLRHTEADAREWVALGNDGWDFESSAAVYEGLKGEFEPQAGSPFDRVIEKDGETESQGTKHQSARILFALSSDFQPHHLVYVDKSRCDTRIGFRRTGWSLWV